MGGFLLIHLFPRVIVLCFSAFVALGSDREKTAHDCVTADRLEGVHGDRYRDPSSEAVLWSRALGSTTA